MPGRRPFGGDRLLGFSIDIVLWGDHLDLIAISLIEVKAKSDYGCFTFNHAGLIHQTGLSKP
ncbi:hypothetical protein D3C78_1468000 [compost metagenome]